MATIKVNIDGETHEVEPSNLELGDGYALITPDSVPDGYFTQEALEQKIQDRIAKAKRNSEQDLLEDDSFHKKVLSKYNIILGEDGKPKGLKPEVDIEEVKAQTAKQVSEDYEQKLDNTRQELSKIKKGKIAGDLLRAGNSYFEEQYLKSFTGADDPFVVKQFADQFDYDPKTGQTALLDEDGESFAVDNKGDRITPEKFFESNAEKLSDLYKDKRQRGSGFDKNGISRKGSEPSPEDVQNMSDEQYAKYRKEKGFRENYMSGN